MRNLLTVACVLLLAGTSPLSAASTLLNSGIANDLALSGGGNFGFPGKIALMKDAGGDLSGVLNYFDLYDASWNVVGHQLDQHNADGSFNQTLATDTNVGWGSFVTTDGTDIYVGRTSLGSDPGNHVIEKVVSSSFTTVVNMLYNYDMQFDPNGSAYAVCNDDGTNKIVKADLSGGTYAAVANLGGNSSELAFDSQGNLYYGTSGLATDKLVKFTSDEIDPSASGFVVLTLADADELTDLRYGCGGVGVDETDNIVFFENTGYGVTPEFHNLDIIEAGKDYSGYGAYRYDLLSTAAAYASNVEAVGNALLYDGVSGNDAAFAVGYGGPIAYVPEPASMALLGLGGLALLLRRRRQR